MTRYWISCELFTVEVSTDDGGIIVRAAPLVQRFLHQPIGDLLNWARQFGGLMRVKL